MIIHASITADQPQQTAELIARLLDGAAFPWMGPGEGTWIATGGQVAGQTVEVLQRGSEFHPKIRQHVETRRGPPARHSGFHLLLETSLSEAAVLALTADAELHAYKVSHGLFDVIEVWLDGCFLLEVMTHDMATAYRALMSPANVQAVRSAMAAGLTPEAIVAAARERSSSGAASPK